MNTSARHNALPLRLSQRQSTEHTLLVLALENTLTEPLEGWALHLDLPRPATAQGNTRQLSRVGSHLEIASTEAVPLEPGALCELHLVIEPPLQRLSDLPTASYLTLGERILEVELVAHNLPASSSARPAPAKALVPACPIIPTPAKYQLTAGTFEWDPQACWQVAAEAEPAIEWLHRMLGTAKNQSHTGTLKAEIDTSLAQEQHQITVTSDGLIIRAAEAAGFTRAAASLVQLAEKSNSGAVHLPCLTLDDSPLHNYRGLMLDCARHFHPVAVILDLLDWMALYKLNHFHWHLTDDEAWRLEILAFPELTDTGAWRGQHEQLPPQLGSGHRRYGGYYSQADVKVVLAAASQRNITVIPEIDIPGHSRAAIQSLPQLLQEPADTSQYLSVQFFDDNVLNPGLAGTYHFLDTVLAEVCELFPGSLVHMGADEVPQGVWQNSPACRSLMEREAYTEALDLQGHLLRHVQDFLSARGRTLVGWEEAAHGEKLKHCAPICAWTGNDAVAATAAAGYPVISCPAPWAYLDLAWDNSPEEPGLYWAGTADLQACYTQPPFPENFEGEPVGVQANLWSELLYSQSRIEYMMFPRVFATAEWGWSTNAGSDWDNFRARAAHHLQWLANRGVHGRMPGELD